MRRLAPAFALLLATSAPAGAVSPNPEDLVPTPEVQTRCRALVRQLGSEDFAEREDAQKRLADLGRFACPALRAGAAASTDPEIRARCLQLLPGAAALDTKARLGTFLADTEGRYEHDLPAWKAFRSLVCTDWAFAGRVIWTDRALEKAARQVFVDLVSAPTNRRLLLAVEGSRLELTELVVARKLELYERRYGRGGDADTREPTLEETAALLFADSRIGSQYIPRRGGSVTFLLSGSGFTAAARGTDEKGKVYRAIAAAWLDSRNEPREMYTAMGIAGNLDLNDQAAALGARLLTMPGVISSHRGRAATNLVYYGSAKHLPLLAKGLTDSSVVYTAQVPAPNGGAGVTNYEVQSRDVALAVSVLLAGQKLADYGFTDRLGGSEDDGRSYSHPRYYFADDAARKKALAKWAERLRTGPNG